MKKLKMITLVFVGVTILILFILRAQYITEDGIKAKDFSISGITDGVGIKCGEYIDNICITVPDSVEKGEVITVSSDPNVAYLEIDRDSMSDDRAYTARVVAVSEGIAELFVRSADGGVISEKYRVCVYADDEPENNDSFVSEENPQAGSERKGLVYVTPSGNKYHLSKKCAGETAKEITLEEAFDKGYSPCKNCAINK